MDIHHVLAWEIERQWLEYLTSLEHGLLNLLGRNDVKVWTSDSDGTLALELKLETRT